MGMGFIVSGVFLVDMRQSTGGQKVTTIRGILIQFVFHLNIQANDISKGPNMGKLSGNPNGKNPSDVWIFPNVKSNHPEKTTHPCQFPVELVERLVLSMTDEDDLVFDPYMGVGATVIAALKHGRHGYGCDIVQEYVDITHERIKLLAAGTLRTRPMGKPIYDPNLPNGGHQ